MKGANGFSIGQIPEQLLLIIQNTRAVLIYGKTMFYSTLYRFWENAFMDGKTMWWDRLLCIDWFTGKICYHIYLHFPPIQTKSKKILDWID